MGIPNHATTLARSSISPKDVLKDYDLTESGRRYSYIRVQSQSHTRALQPLYIRQQSPRKRSCAPSSPHRVHARARSKSAMETAEGIAEASLEAVSTGAAHVPFMYLTERQQNAVGHGVSIAYEIDPSVHILFTCLRRH